VSSKSIERIALVTMAASVSKIQTHLDARWVAGQIFRFLGLGLRPIPTAF